ncbi:MAG: T9SS C-terminal target domain-containing protein, partial [Mucilaginibacter polytrichastri]|nr:T9SS C-terminal target domain-containing protein [Mucilaginibacter polytrichastri]
MRLIFTTFCCILFLFSYSQAPALTWQKSLGGSQLDFAPGISKTADGGSIVASSTRSYDGDVTSYEAGSANVWVTKLDGSGTITWQKCFYGGLASAVIQTLDGGYMVAGYNDSGVVRNHGGIDVWLIKLDSAGNLQWQNLLGGTGADYPNTVRQTKDSGYIVACTTSSTDGDVTGNHTKGLPDGGALDWWIVKTDKGGKIQWEECLGGSAADLDPHAEQTFDNGYIITGTTASNDGNVSGLHGTDYDSWVVKLDSAGIPQWQKCYGGTYGEEGKSIKQTLDSGYVMAATARSSNGDVSQNHGNADYWIVKLDAKGNMVWKHCYGGADDDIPADLQLTGNGFVAAGYTASNNGDVTGFHGTYDFWVIKTDTLGNLLWQKTLGGENDDEAYSLSCNRSGTYIISGFSNSYTGDVTGNHGDIDSWVVYLQDDNVLP